MKTPVRTTEGITFAPDPEGMKRDRQAINGMAEPRPSTPRVETVRITELMKPTNKVGVCG